MSDLQNVNDQNVTTEPAAQDTGKWMGAFAAYGQAYEAVKKNLQPALLIVGAYIGVALLSSVAQGKSLTDEGYKSGEAVVGLIFLLAMMVYAFAISDKKVISIKQLMKPNASMYFTILFTSILCSLAVVASMVLFIIPVIWVLPWVYLAMYAAFDKKLSPVAAIKYSKQMTRNHKGKVWGLIGVSILLFIASFIFAAIPGIGIFIAYAGLMFVSVLNNGANAILYRYLQKHEA